MNVQIPANYTPRFYQMPFLRAMDSGIVRACWVCHRRGGKTKTVLNMTIKKAFERVGSYYHCFPEYGQGRKIIWDGMDGDGHKLLDHHIPLEVRKNTNSTEMKIELINGSIYQVVGADNFNSVMGSNPVGLVLDEYSLSDKYKSAWDYFRPILAENGGWAVFPFTPRGRTHGWDIYQMALGNPKWFCQILTVDDTKIAGILDKIKDDRESGMSEDMIQQEYYCSFIASTENIVIPFEFIQRALKTQKDYGRSGRIAGYDAARFGDDRNALVIRQAGQLIYIDCWGGQDTVQSAGKIIAAYRNKFFDCVAMDTIGLGSGVYDMVKNADVPCVSVNVAESSSDDSRFVRMRDEVWWKCREWFMDDASISAGIPKEYIDALVKDIQDIQYEYNAKGQIKIESKDDFKRRMRDKGGAFSPDVGDALCCTFSPLIEMKIKTEDQAMFGGMIGAMAERTYDPLTYGLQNG